MSIRRRIKRNIAENAVQKWKHEMIYRSENNICDYCEDMIVGTNYCSCNRYMCNEHFDFSRNICGYCCDNLDN